MQFSQTTNESSTHLDFGVNLIGYFGQGTGLGESSRLMMETLKQANIPFVLISVNGLLKIIEDETFSDPIENTFKYSINLFTVTSFSISMFIQKTGWGPFKNRYNIGLVFWETTQIIRPCYIGWKHLNEIWTMSRFMQEILSRIAPTSIHYFPHPLELNYTESDSNKSAAGQADEPFTFLFCFSFCSKLDRKNPQAIIDAFQIAFPDQQNVRLIIKSKDGHLFHEQLQRMKTRIEKDSRVVWVDRNMNGQDRFDFMNCCDCYISLHRSEGFGLTLAEAMLLNKPVIATGYSGNLDFMNEENSYLCSYRMVRVGRGHLPYPPQGLWAEPDIYHAAELMRHVVENREEARIKSCKAKDFIQTHHSFQKVGALLAQQLASIRLPIQNPKPWAYFEIKYWKTIRKIAKVIQSLLRWCFKTKGNSKF